MACAWCSRRRTNTITESCIQRAPDFSPGRTGGKALVVVFPPPAKAGGSLIARVSAYFCCGAEAPSRRRPCRPPGTEVPGSPVARISAHSCTEAEALPHPPTPPSLHALWSGSSQGPTVALSSGSLRSRLGAPPPAKAGGSPVVSVTTLSRIQRAASVNSQKRRKYRRSLFLGLRELTLPARRPPPTEVGGSPEYNAFGGARPVRH